MHPTDVCPAAIDRQNLPQLSAGHQRRLPRTQAESSARRHCPVREAGQVGGPGRVGGGGGRGRGRVRHASDKKGNGRLTAPHRTAPPLKRTDNGRSKP